MSKKMTKMTFFKFSKNDLKLNSWLVLDAKSLIFGANKCQIESPGIL